VKFEKGSGLDLDTKPFPSMIVPLASSKIMKVFGASGFSLFDDRNILEIKPLDSSVVMMDKLVLSSLAGMGSPFDSSSASIQLFQDFFKVILKPLRVKNRPEHFLTN
jgi:hypothetical protein